MRKARGMSTYTLADKLTEIGWPIQQASLARIETGLRRINVDDLVALAEALGVTPDDLLGDVVAGYPYPPGHIITERLVMLQQAVIDALANGATVDQARVAIRQALSLAQSVTDAGVSLQSIRVTSGELEDGPG